MINNAAVRFDRYARDVVFKKVGSVVVRRVVVRTEVGLLKVRADPVRLREY